MFYLKAFSFLVVNFSIYLDRCVYVMGVRSIEVLLCIKLEKRIRYQLNAYCMLQQHGSDVYVQIRTKINKIEIFNYF